MNFKIGLLILTALLVSCQGKSQSRITIHIPTADSESEYIWNTIQDINFFEENKYDVSLPKGLLMEELKDKAKAGRLKDTDYERLKVFVQDSVYDTTDYQKGYEAIESKLELINKITNEISQLAHNWHFKAFKTYQVNLSLYGPGGGFNPDAGIITIFTTVDGQFKNQDNPANIIIHEITHIGIEASIIAKYQVPHTLKERIVDTFVILHFNAYLPDYRVQEMGETRPDQYLITKLDLKRLDYIVEVMMKDDQ